MTIEKCELCRRKCGVKREPGKTSNGFCRLPSNARVARCAAHFYEEPSISGERGSGAIFFSGCVMRCEFCQNHEISRMPVGKEVDEKALTDMMKELVFQGVHNINFVSPAPFMPVIKSALEIYKPPVPVIYNCCGYESKRSIAELKGLVDVFLPDFKYADNELAAKLSASPDYAENAVEAIGAMYDAAGHVEHDENGMIKSGVMIRHLVLPGYTDNSKKVLDIIKKEFSSDAFISLMAQFTPNGKSVHPELARKLTPREYDDVCDYMISLGFENGFVQEADSAQESYIPSWDLV